MDKTLAVNPPPPGIDIARLDCAKYCVMPTGRYGRDRDAPGLKGPPGWMVVELISLIECEVFPRSVCPKRM